ncbi:unnamed protein product [marine sediment metagenome]|uniref:Uncharacterized protein n=1 Tax=marine sediment metagenome TaxID=412755 RepID=X1DQ14_9ZZZZ
MRSLDVLVNKWRAFKEFVKRLWDSYLDYYSQSTYPSWDPNFEDIIMYQYLFEEEEAEDNLSTQEAVKKE